MTISDSDWDSEMPLTCLADASFLRNRPREGGENEGNGEEAERVSEEQEGMAKENHRVTSMLERVTLSEDGSLDAVTLSSMSLSGWLSTILLNPGRCHLFYVKMLSTAGLFQL